jgi:hypothetical protein
MQNTGFTSDERSDFIKSQIIDGIGAIVLGLGMYGMMAAENPFHPVFSSQGFNITLLGIGALFLLTEWFILWPVLKARQRRARGKGVENGA